MRARERGDSRWWKLIAGLALVVWMTPLTACNGPFFVNQCSICGTTTTGSGGGTTTTPTITGDFAYVANSSAGDTYLSEYAITSGTLSSLGTISLGYIPVALAVAPSNSFLYVASTPGYASPGIYLYSVGTTGTLTVANGGSPLATDEVAAMAISPDGDWLYTVNYDGLTMAQYAVNTTSGALTLEGEITLPGTSCELTAAVPVSQSCSVTVGPSGDYLVASLNISGDWVYPYSKAGGITQIGVQEFTSYSATNPVGNFATVLDDNNYAYVAQTNSVSTYGITSSGITSEGTVSYASGSVPRSIVLSKTYDFVYTANQDTGTISGFGVSGSAALNEISGSPYTGPASVSALGVDNSGDYLLAVGYNGSSGVVLYSISSTGALTQVSALGSGTSTLYPALVAMTH